MANRNLDDIKTLGKGRVQISGSFAPAGTGAPTSVKGNGFTVARASAGTFTVTFADAYNDLISVDATLQLASADDKFMQVGSYSSTNKTLTLVIWDISGAAATDVAADPNNRVNFRATFKNSGVGA